MQLDDRRAIDTEIGPAEGQSGAPSAVLYLRVSTKDQARKGGEEEGFSIPAQREAGKRKAASLGAALVAEFVDAGESARSADRPELQRMLAYLRETPVDCQAAYSSAPPRIRRLFNQVFFKKLYVEDEYTLHGEPAAPFADLLAYSAAVESDASDASDDWISARESGLNDCDPEARGFGVASVKEPKLVAGAGLEPATSWL